jgi:hypothetical protein
MPVPCSGAEWPRAHRDEEKCTVEYRTETDERAADFVGPAHGIGTVLAKKPN